MQVTVDELLMIIGSKEAELFLLRRQLAALQAPPPEEPADG